MANSTYLFACGHPQEEAGALRLWQAILNTDILSPQQQQQENPDGPTKLAHLPCPACRDAGPNFYKNHLAYLFLSAYSTSVAVTAPLLAEMAQLLWELLSSDGGGGGGGEQEQDDEDEDEDEDEDLVRWTHVLLRPQPPLLTPPQYEGPFLTAVLRACGLARLRRVTRAAVVAAHALLPPRGILRDPVAAREWIDGVLAEGVLLVEREGDADGGVGMVGMRTLRDYERLREDYAAQLRVCDALGAAYEVLDEAREAAALVLQGEGGVGGLGTQEKKELMRRVVRACLVVRKEALDLRKFREG
ncbi:hypothetical protein F4809DRAFT_660396 [Biscogniauxia mediterranea]|nr:hypothetical protein F4809DRAFT_660396 [Biscogniauxia mediterranea]